MSAETTQIAPEVEKFLKAARAGEVAQCKAMLDANAKLVNEVDAGGYSALHFAAYNNNVALIDMLAGFKPNFDVQNHDLNTPLVMAAKAKQHDAIRRLVELGANVNCEGRDGSTAAHHAASLGNTATVRLLAELGAKVAQAQPSPVGSVLHWACHSGDIDTVGTLIHDFGADVNAVDAHGGSPLFVACHMKKSDVVLFLLEHGANPNVVAKDGTTPLHFAAEHATLEDVKNLLAFGADPAAKDNEGKTPAAVAEAKGQAQSAKEMIKPASPAAKREEDAARFKERGNKVFMEGENVKASKFYSLAIAKNPKNHVFFSNRSACYFNMRQYVAALYDAKQCIRLNPKWAKGYFRLGATLHALKRTDEAKAVAQKGLALDANNYDLKTLLADLAKK